MMSVAKFEPGLPHVEDPQDAVDIPNLVSLGTL
jgi:hypothetical protein